MSVGKTVGKSLGNPKSQELGFSPIPSQSLPPPKGGVGREMGNRSSGRFRPNTVPNPNAVGEVVGTSAERTAAHKARLAADPRFAGWAAGGDGIPDPVASRALAERAELVRIAAARIVRNEREGRPTADEFTLAWAKQVIATTPALCGLLGTGEPA